MGITALVDINLDLLSVGIAIAGIVLLGTIIYFNNPQSITNRTFLYFSILTAVWGVSNYLEYKFNTITSTLWALRFHIFLSTWHALLFFQLAYVFPKDEVKFPRWYKFILVPVVVITAFLTLTPFVFSGISALAPPGEVTNPSRGPGIALFSGVAFGLLILGMIVLLRKVIAAHAEERRQLLSVFIGMVLTAGLILLFNVLLPVIFNQLSFIPLAALFILPFIALISYAIFRHHLFNLRVAATAFLGFMVTVFSFVNVVYSTSFSAVAINVTAFIIILLGSIKIVRDTLELQIVNERQEGLIHFISHEVKGFLTKDQAVFASLVEGDLGPLPEQVKTFVTTALTHTREEVESVTDILKASNQKKGTVTYQKAPFDLLALVQMNVEETKAAAEKKGLILALDADPKGVPYTLNGDEKEIGDHVLRNLIDNSINYTPSGKIDVSLKRQGKKIIFTVADTGVGISDEDKKRLFTEGGHGKDSQRVNVHSTGYGLYIAKNIVVAHGGTIRAESAGPSKGSQFIVELPVS